MSLGLADGVVILVPHDSNWESVFQSEKKIISSKVHDLLDVEHCGSTTIPNIPSKPIMNICASINSEEDLDQIKKDFLDIGYQYKPSDFPDHHLFFKQDNGLTTHHVHVMNKDGVNWQKAIKFRDYLISHPDTAQKYADLKLSLAEKFPNDRESYGKGKNPFIDNVLKHVIPEAYE